MRLCMFHPVGHPLERGWVGRIEGDRVVHLAAQTLQSFLTGGGAAREHAVYSLAEVVLLAPVLHPPAVRVFDGESSFAFANPAAIVGPGAAIRHSPARDGPGRGGLTCRASVACVIGDRGAIAGFTLFAEWRDPSYLPPKDRDFALGLGPVVVTADVLDPTGLELAVRVDGVERMRTLLPPFDWAAARELVAFGTVLRAGDLLAAPPPAAVEVARGSEVELELEAVGVLAQRVVE